MQRISFWKEKASGDILIVHTQELDDAEGEMQKKYGDEWWNFVEPLMTERGFYASHLPGIIARVHDGELKIASVFDLAENVF
ncbi:MAG: hypothetical protein Q8Q48_01310 [Candidatus Staskawiczbacteria bacterium]|nr:hypothetical protein [Candidatus Staskawiczbacteria bacterium]